MVSKQRECQRRNIAAGNCGQCGKPRNMYKSLCDACQAKERERSRVRMRKRGGHRPQNECGIGRPIGTIKKPLLEHDGYMGP